MTDQFRKTVRRFFRREKHEHFLTINFNRDFTPKKRQLLVKGLFRRIDRKLLGRRYMDLIERRADFIIVEEHPDSNAHYHCLGHFDPQRKLSTKQLAALIEREWRKLCKSGTVDLQRINRTRPRLASYVSKSLTKENWGDRVMTSREFWGISSKAGQMKDGCASEPLSRRVQAN
jgi:hypothetical protein